MNGFTPAACTCDGRLYLSPAEGKAYRLTGKATPGKKSPSSSRRASTIAWCQSPKIRCSFSAAPRRAARRRKWKWSEVRK